MAVPSSAIEHYDAGRFAQAAAVLRRVVQRDSRDHEAAHLLAICLSQADQHDAAGFMFERAVGLAPGRGDYRANWAEALRRAERLPEALGEAERAVELAPGSGPANLALGTVLRDLDRHASAVVPLERARAIDPGLVMAHVHLADSLLALGRPEEALAVSAGSVAAEPGNYLHAVTRATFHLFASGVEPGELLAAHHAVAGPMSLVPLPRVEAYRGSMEPDRRLRVAYLSPDLIEHSVVRFLEPLLDHHDRGAFELVAFSASEVVDATSERLKPKFDRWHTIAKPDESAIGQLLIDEGIDIAIDLAGHTANSIVYPLRQRIVPVQATYLGYPATTALPGVEYRLVDALTDPAGAEEQATERLVRVEGCFLCFRTPRGDGVPEVEAPPVVRGEGGGVTFGSFNFLGKVSRQTKRLWARVLNEVPGSRLLLKDSALDHEEVRAAVRADLALAGLEPGRVELVGRLVDRREHLRRYRDVDIALDPTPYNGTTTTCEALWMGVPVVTLAGRTHHSRVGVSLLSAIGRAEWIARDEDDYVAIAAGLAADRAGLAAARMGQRAAMAGSVLCDEAGFTRRFEAALRACWREACGAAGGGQREMTNRGG
jgi:protein O-GlcNAc transferase